MQLRDIKVLLIHPEISRTEYNFVGIIENECLEAEYLVTILKQAGCETRIYDGQIETRSVADTLKEYQPAAVYICGRARQENFMLEYAKAAKELCVSERKCITIIGGLHAQLSYQRMQIQEVDYVLKSFDVFKMLEILAYEYDKGESTPKDISGISYQQDGLWVDNVAEPFDIKRLPFPDRTYFYAHPKRYRYLELEHAAWVRTAYFCPYHCRFCHRNLMNCGTFVSRDIESVVEEIEGIQSDNIYIVDDDFLYNESRLEKFISLIRSKKIHKKYICYGRADFIVSHENLMRELYSIGLYYVLTGLESYNDKVLKEYDKKTDVSVNSQSISICNEIGIHMMGMFILDLDYTASDFRKLYRFICEQKLTHVAVSILTPEIGTPCYELYKDRMITDNPSHFDYLHVTAQPAHMSVKKYYLCYYLLLIRLFMKAQRDGVYDFLDYGMYVRSFIKNIFRKKRKNDDE